MGWRVVEPLSLPFLRHAGTNITSLTISDVSGGQLKAIHQILARLPQLTHLAYIDKHHMSVPFVRRVQRELCPARLVHLSFTASVRNNDMTLWLLSNSTSTLQSLEFGNKVINHEVLAQVLLDVKANIRSLTLPTFDVCPSPSFLPFYSPPRCSQTRLASQYLFAQALQKCTVLEDIVIGAGGLYELLSAISLFQSCPPNIRTITVYGEIMVDELNIVMTTFLQVEAHRLASLKRLSFLDDRSCPHEYDQNQGQAWRAECAALGVDLEILWNSVRAFLSDYCLCH